MIWKCGGPSGVKQAIRPAAGVVVAVRVGFLRFDCRDYGDDQENRLYRARQLSYLPEPRGNEPFCGEPCEESVKGESND